MSKECPLTEVNCDFHYAGCEVQLPRKDMPAHLAENLVTHMSQMATYGHLQKLKTQVLENMLSEKELEIAQLKAKLIEDRSSLQDLQLYTGPPVEIIMTGFAKHKQDGDEWYSEPFYTHPCGYKMCLKVDANGWDYTKGTHVSISVRLMRGQFDDCLQFPFNGKITIQLINWRSSKEHCTRTVRFRECGNDDVTGRVTTGERAPLGYSKFDFLSHSELDYVLKDDCLCFRVARVTDVGQETQLERQCRAIESRVCVPPLEFTMTDFEQQKAEGDCLCSPSFYTHPQGYRMCLDVYANGDGDGKGTHISVFVYLMRGEYDNHLKWPFRGNIAIQLLNQIKDQSHYEYTIHFTDSTPKGRVTTGKRSAMGWGCHKYISHHALNYNKTKNCQYLKFDCLHFRIVKVELKM